MDVSNDDSVYVNSKFIEIAPAPSSHDNVYEEHIVATYSQSRENRGGKKQSGNEGKHNEYLG